MNKGKELFIQTTAYTFTTTMTTLVILAFILLVITIKTPGTNILYLLLKLISSMLFILTITSIVDFIIKNQQGILFYKIDNNGIFSPHTGFVSWNNVKKIQVTSFSINIFVKNIEKLKKQACFSGKMGIFWASIFGYAPVIIPISYNHQKKQEAFNKIMKILSHNKVIFTVK